MMSVEKATTKYQNPQKEGGEGMNRNELQRQIRLEGKTVDQLCSALGISRSAWFRKIGGRSEFTQSEICTLRRELELDDELTGFIFFNDKVS